MYWCAVERNLRSRAFALQEKNAAVPRAYTGRLFVIACKQVRLWAWESDYELNLESPSESAYNNVELKTVARRWMLTQDASPAMRDLVENAANALDRDVRHPLRFIEPKYRHAVAVYLLACAFIFEPISILYLPPSGCMDVGYFRSNILNMKSEDSAEPEEMSDASDMYGAMSRLTCGFKNLSVNIENESPPPQSDIQMVKNSLVDIFLHLKVRERDTVVGYLDTIIGMGTDPTKLQSVPIVFDELSVCKLPKGDVAVYLSKYFSVAEVLNVNFYTRTSIRKLDVTLLGHRAFSKNFIPEAPLVKIERTISGTILRGTVSTLSVPPVYDMLYPSDTFYASQTRQISPALYQALYDVGVSIGNVMNSDDGITDELSLFIGCNLLQTLAWMRSDTQLKTMFQGANNASPYDDNSGNATLLYRRYAGALAMLYYYQEKQTLLDAIDAFILGVISDGPCANNGSVVYPVYPSLGENIPFDYLSDPDDEMAYRIFMAYHDSDLMIANVKPRIEIDHYEVISPLGAIKDIRYSTETTPYLRDGGLSSMFTKVYDLRPDRYVPTSIVPGLTWDKALDEPDILTGTMTIDPFVEHRTGRTLEIRVPINGATIFYDPTSVPKTLNSFPGASSDATTLVFNAQWSWKNAIPLVQGRIPGKEGTSPTSLALGNLDYVLDGNFPTLFFFNQARLRLSNVRDSRFSWIVGRYLGAYGKSFSVGVKIDPTVFVSYSDEDPDNGMFAAADWDKWLDKNTVYPLISGTDDILPRYRVVFETK